MKSLILYDSMGGNTAMVAETIQHALTAKSMAPNLVKVDKELSIDLFDYDLVFIGSPVIDWLPTKTLMDFVKRKMKEYNNQGRVTPSSPLIPGKFGISFGTYAGPHIGEKEARPMTMWLDSFLEHLGYAALDQWLVVGKHHHKPDINRNGRLGNIEDRPNTTDLSAIENRVTGLVDSLIAWN
ncbi:flavodoxin family protein [Desulfoluna spongiiphila]|uniref:Flavodoxin domain-containing protein n=1 Tax=Desulfoluna spongiiphila TaxID=419481 RepID=A0A1G5HJM4_9BACT|nr:flavodoxin domain-containing protein [Desulfoluna spongiiphila]SCY63976.1 Flavodoxin domain-containing protein [Desulfoluna spongiiphila]VVS93492.1 flavodoxin domain [Desulfoluna spongiiphila]